VKTGDKANKTGAIILLTVVVIVMLVFNGRDTDGRLQGGHAVHRVGYRLFRAVDGCVAERRAALPGAIRAEPADRLDVYRVGGSIDMGDGG